MVTAGTSGSETAYAELAQHLRRNWREIFEASFISEAYTETYAKLTQPYATHDFHFSVSMHFEVYVRRPLRKAYATLRTTRFSQTIWKSVKYLSKGKFKATNHRVLWNKSKRMSIPFFFEPSYDFKMSPSFLNSHSKNNKRAISFQNFFLVEFQPLLCGRANLRRVGQQIGYPTLIGLCISGHSNALLLVVLAVQLL